MKTLIVYVHPKTKGHGPKILETVEEFHKKNKIKYEVLDLYKMKYDPILHEKEHYTAGGRDISKENKALQKKIDKTDKLIFIYPVWWYSMPAILKGFLDRILTSHWAFRYEKKWWSPIAIPIPLLKGKKAVAFITSGSPRWISFIPGMLCARILLKEILKFCGIKTRVYQLGGCQQCTEERIEIIQRMVDKGLTRFY